MVCKIEQPQELIPVVIVTMGTEACEKQINQLKKNQALFIVLVLNGCSQKIVQHFQTLVGSSGICIGLTRNEGGSGGFRTGMQYVLNHYKDSCPVWLLDDDAEINDNTLSELLKAAADLNAQKINWGALGSMILLQESPNQVVEVGAWVNLKNGGFILNFHGEKIENVPKVPLQVQYCAAASLLTQVNVIRKVGIFADIFIHYDDVEWCLRLAHAGFSVYGIPSSMIRHPTNIQKPATWIRYYDAANCVWLFKKYFPDQLQSIIFRQKLKCYYFHLHGFHKTAKLYEMGIRDGLAGHKRKYRDELNFEDYTNVFSWKSDDPKLFITSEYQHIKIFQERFGQNSRVIRLPYFFPFRIVMGLYAKIYTIFHPHRVIILDDYFRNKFYLPLLCKKIKVYNVILNKEVQK